MKSATILLLALLVLAGCAQEAQTTPLNETDLGEYLNATPEKVEVQGTQRAKETLSVLTHSPGTLILEGLGEDRVIVEDGIARRVITDRNVTLIIDEEDLEGVRIALNATTDGSVWLNGKLAIPETYRSKHAFGDLMLYTAERSTKRAEDPIAFIDEHLTEGDTINDPYGILDWSRLRSTFSYQETETTLPVTFSGDHEFLIVAGESLRVTTTTPTSITLENLAGEAVAASPENTTHIIHGLTPSIYALRVQGEQYRLTINTAKILVRERIRTTGRTELFFTCPGRCELSAVPHTIYDLQNLISPTGGSWTADEPGEATRFNISGGQRLLIPKGNLTLSGFPAASLTADTYFSAFRYARSDEADLLVLPTELPVPLEGEGPYRIFLTHDGDRLELYGATVTPVE